MFIGLFLSLSLSLIQALDNNFEQYTGDILSIQVGVFNKPTCNMREREREREREKGRERERKVERERGEGERYASTERKH